MDDIIQTLVNAVKNGKYTIEQIPQYYREQVQKALDDSN